MPNVTDLSCGNYKCVYGNKKGIEKTFGVCKCIPYPPRHDVVGVEKVKSAKWAMHELRRQNKKLHEQVAFLTGMIHDR